MSLRDVTIAQMRNRATEYWWRHAPEAHGGFGNFQKVSWVESCLGRIRLTFACSRRPRASAHMLAVGRWKSQNRKNVHLSPYVEEPLNSKVIKSFVPELRSRKCFLCSMYMFYEHYITFRVAISISWLWHTDSRKKSISEVKSWEGSSSTIRCQHYYL